MMTTFKMALPSWVIEYGKQLAQRSAMSDEEKMQIAIDLSTMETGGPFGAVIFNSIDNAVVSLGVNLVTRNNCALLHAEMVAIILAQRQLNTYDLSTQGRFSLFTSTEPCAMCLGAIPWTGISRVVCGATESDATEIGFDEGDKPQAGILGLREKGIEVVTERLRNKARRVLLEYASKGGIIYNGFQA
jgi:tRNA(Arg) A34 adenosine deaminase TadA